MKLLHFLLATSALLSAQPIPVTLPQPVSMDQTVTVIQPVEVSKADVTRIVIDTAKEEISFQTTSGNHTIVLSGAAYDAIAANFREQFATSIAPLIQNKLKGKRGRPE